PPPPPPSAAPSGAVPASGALAKEGWFGISSGLHARVEMLGVERRPDRSVLHFTLTNLGDKEQFEINAFGHALGDFQNFPIPLVDPVGRKVYQPRRTVSTGQTVGSERGRLAPGVVYQAEVHYPPIPEGVTTVTALTSGTTGEFTGIPVGAAAPRPAPTASISPAPGTVAALPERDGPMKPPVVLNLYDITEGQIEETTSSGVEERIGLRTDVLFAFNSAQLSGKAKAVLDKVADETRAKADPAQPPIHVIGHTDSKGADDYNLKLSRRRAAAVLRELQARLGTDYQYRARGEGEAAPVAKEGGPDDALARSRNRRVEISYQIKQRTPDVTTTATADAVTAGAGAPAAFRPSDGEIVASRYGRFNGQKRRIDVRPFYRDGHYLVAVFDVVNEGPGQLPALADYSDLDYAGGDFTAFSVIDPATQDVYRAVRMGPLAERGAQVHDYVEPGWASYRLRPGEPNRGFFYVPAPPDDVRVVTFDGGPFGKVLEVPIAG
ncbi:OmpA family protein, partial [Actinocorallia lasiicapitis]